MSDAQERGYEYDGDLAGDEIGREYEKPKQHSLVSVCLVICLSLLGAFLLRTLVVEAYEIKGASMDPTFQSGHRVIVAKVLIEIERGDIIVFHAPDSSKTLVKRVIGLPGDKYDMHGLVRTLKANEYFVQGDNTHDSHDSRFFGPIKEDMIIGEVVYRWWPYEKAGAINADTK